MFHQNFLAAEPKVCSKCPTDGNKPCYNCGRRCLKCPYGHHSHQRSIECKTCKHQFKKRTTYKKKGHKKKTPGVCKPKKKRHLQRPPHAISRAPSLDLTPEETKLINEIPSSPHASRSPPASPDLDEFGFLHEPLDFLHEPLHLSRSDSTDSLIRDPEPNDLNSDALEIDAQTKITMLEFENDELKKKIQFLELLLGKSVEELEETKRGLAEPALENSFSV
jgi:hypothetical protein